MKGSASFVMIAMTTLARVDIRPLSKLVLAYLQNAGRAAGHAWPSVSAISQAVGASERSIRRSLRELEMLELIAKKPWKSGQRFTFIFPTESADKMAALYNPKARTK